MKTTLSLIAAALAVQIPPTTEASGTFRGNSAASYTVVPEPTTALLGGLGALALLRRRRP